MQPRDPSEDAPVFEGFRLPSDQTAEPSRETATSFDSQPQEANKHPRKPPHNPVLTESNDHSRGSGLAELKGFRLVDFENPRGTAVSFAAGHRPDLSTPDLKEGLDLSDLPAPRPLKSPPDELKRRAGADPPVLKEIFFFSLDEAHARDAAASVYRGSVQTREEPSGSTASSPSSGGPSSTFSHPPTSLSPVPGGNIESTVLRGFRLPDRGPSSPPNRDAAVSFDGPHSPAVISHRSLLHSVAEDSPAAPDVGLSIVLTADSPPNRSLRNSFSSPKIPSPGNTSSAGRSIINRGQGLGGLPKGRLTWNDVINGASEETADTRTGNGLGEAGADEAADADCGGGSDDVSDRGGEPEGEVCKQVVAEGADVTLGAVAREGEDDDVSTVEVGPLSESHVRRSGVKLNTNAEKGVPKGVAAFADRMRAEQEKGMDGRDGRAEEDGTERNQRKYPASRGQNGTAGRSTELTGGDWHEEGEVRTKSARETGTGNKVMSGNRTAPEPSGTEWGRPEPEPEGMQRTSGRDGPELQRQKEWTDSHEDVNEPVISAARAFSPKQKAPVLGSPFRDEGVRSGGEVSWSPSFARLPSFSDREGSEVVSAAKAFSPKGGGKTRLGISENSATCEEESGFKNGQKDGVRQGREGHKSAEGKLKSDVENASTPGLDGLEASRDSGGSVPSSGVTSAEAKGEVSSGDGGRSAVRRPDKSEPGEGGPTQGAKARAAAKAVPSKPAFKKTAEAVASKDETGQVMVEVSELKGVSTTVMPEGKPGSKQTTARSAAKPQPAATEPGEDPRSKPRRRRPEGNGPVADNRESESSDGLTLLAAQYEDSPPPRVPRSEPPQASQLRREQVSRPEGDAVRGVEGGRILGLKDSSPAADAVQLGRDSLVKRNQPKPRLEECHDNDGRRAGETLDESLKSDTLQLGTTSPKKQTQSRPRAPESSPGSPSKAGEASKAPRKPAPKPSNPDSAPPSTPPISSGGQIEQRIAPHPAKNLARPPDSVDGASVRNRPSPEETGGYENQVNLRPVKSSRPVSSGQQKPRTEPRSPPPPSSPPPANRPAASDAAGADASDGPERLGPPELSISPRVARAVRPKPHTVPEAGSTPRNVPRGSHVAPDPLPSSPDDSRGWDPSPRSVPRGSHVVSNLPVNSDTPRSSDGPPADPYLLSEPYKPSTYGEPARPTSGGRPLTAERPPSAETASRYTYSERPVSAERWVAPSEAETLTHPPNPSENLPGDHARAFPPEMAHALPFSVSGMMPTLGHVAAPQWPLALGPDGQFVRSSSEGFGAVVPLNPGGFPSFLDAHQQLQAQFMQRYSGVSFPPPGLANPYGNPLSKPENAPLAHAYPPSLSQSTAQSQEFPNPQSQPQNGLNQTPFAHLQSALNPFGFPANPGLQYSPFSHPYFPYGIPPPFYSPPPPVFPFASAPGPLNQFSQAGTLQGGPFAGSSIPPPEPRPTSRQGLNKSASARSELLKARDMAVQRAQQRASKKEAPAAAASLSATNPPEPKPNPRPASKPLTPASTTTTGGAKPAAVSAPRNAFQTGNSKPLGPSGVLRSPEGSSQQPGLVGASDVISFLHVPSSRRQQAAQFQANPLTNPPVNPSANPSLNPLPNPAPNLPYTPGQPPQAAAESLPSYDDFLKFLRFRSAIAGHVPGVLTSASALAGAFSPAPPHPAPLVGGVQTSANTLGDALTSAIPNARPPAGLPLLPSATSREAAQAGLLTSAAARERAAADHQKLASAARTIQTLWREHKLSKRERRLREAPERRAGMLLTWHFRARFLHLKRVAVFLQSLRRGVLARRRFWATQKAVRIIQSAWKLFRASLSGWQRGKLRELRDFHRYVRENLEVVGLEAPSFRSFARLMERLAAATEGARVRRRLRGRKASALVSEMRDIRDLLRQLDAEKARGGTTPDRQLEKTLRVQLRQKHVLLERAAHKPLLSSSPSTVNTPLPSPHPSSGGLGRNHGAFGRNQGGFESGLSSSGRDLGRSGRTAGDSGRNPGSLGPNPEGFERDQGVPDALRAWASESVGGRTEERRRSSYGNDGAGGRAYRSTFEKNEALAAAYAESARTSFASGANPSRAFSHHDGARGPGASAAESNRISFRGASIGFGHVPPPVAASRLVDWTGSRRAFVADESTAGTFGQFAGRVFRTFDEGLSLSPVRVNSPPSKSRVTTAGQANRILRDESSDATHDARKRDQRERARCNETGFEEGSIDFEDVQYDADSDDVAGINRNAGLFNQASVPINRPGSSRQETGAYTAEYAARTSASAHRRLPGDGSRSAVSHGDGSSVNGGSAVPHPNRVSYDDIPITASATPRYHLDLHVDVPSRSNPPSQNLSPSENSGRGPAKRPFLRARSGRLGTSFTIPDHLKLSFIDTPRGASGDPPSGTAGDAPGGGMGPALDSAELGPSTAPGNLGRSLFANGHRVKRRVKRNPLEGEISILERDEEGEESGEPPKRAFLQRKSKAMPMQKLDWSKVKPLVEARLDPEKIATSSAAGAPKKNEPPPAPDYKNVKSRLLAYRDASKKNPSVEEELPFEPGDQAPLLKPPMSPRRKPGKSAAHNRKRNGSEESFDGGKRSGHVAARDRTEQIVRNDPGRLEGARKEAWGGESGTDSEGRSLGSQNRRPPRKAESRKKQTGNETNKPGKSGRGASGHLHQEGSEEEPAEFGSEGGLSSAGELLERMYRKLQREGGVEFGALFPRRRGGESVIPRLRGDEDMFSDQGNSLYSRLTRESRFDRLELDRLTFVTASAGSRER